MSKDRKEARERAKQRSSMKKDTFEGVAAERAQELEAMRQRTAELRALRLAHEKRGRTRKVISGARVAKSVTKETLAEWLQAQKGAGRKT